MGKPIFVIFQLDTEDLVTRETDDVLLDLVSIFNKYGIKGSFAIVGEKARKILEGKRDDVIKALSTQDVAYQSNYHSVHPTISEYLSDKEWDEGVKEFITREISGLKDLENIFGMKASAFIQPGGSWAPQALYAVRKLGINVYADGIFEEQPVWYCYVLAIKGSISYGAVFSGSSEHFLRLKKMFEEKYNEIKDKGGFIVIVLHPCMFKTREFWDSVNYAKGRNPIKLLPAPLVSNKEYVTKINEFDEFLQFVLSHKNIKVITYHELPKYIEEHPKNISIEKIFKFAEKISARISYYTIDGLTLSVSEIFGVIIDTLNEYYDQKRFPHNVKIRKLLGPYDYPPKTSELYTSMKSILEAVRSVKEFLDDNNRVPDYITIDGYNVGPGTFLRTISEILIKIKVGEKISGNIPIKSSNEIPYLYGIDILDRIKRNWKWIILPENFYSEKIVKYSLLQLWTWKPAELRDQNETKSPTYSS